MEYLLRKIGDVFFEVAFVILLFGFGAWVMYVISSPVSESQVVGSTFNVMDQDKQYICIITNKDNTLDLHCLDYDTN